MNDRYLYRAKWTDNGEFVEGLLTIMLGQFHIINPDDENTAYLIDEITICQCTGLRDKNGKLIWENDICRRILLPTKRIETNFRIAYVPYKCCLSAIDLDGSNVTFLSDYINNQYEVEVIGSAIDNPELLEN